MSLHLKWGNLRFLIAALFRGAVILLVAGTSLRAEVKIEDQEVGPTGSAVKYAISPKGLHLATATMKGSRPIILMDGVAGPAFDELIWVKGQNFEQFNQAAYHRSKDTEMSPSDAPVVFSEDGSRFAYVGRQGGEFVIMLDGKEFARGPFEAGAVQSLAFMPGGKRLCYILTTPESKEGKRVTRFVAEGDGSNPPNNSMRGGDVSFSGDGGHYAYFVDVVEDDVRQPHLVVDGKVDPPEYGTPNFDIVARSDGPLLPVFTGDSKRVITVRRLRPPKTRQRSGFLQAPQTVFFGQKSVLEAPFIEKRAQTGSGKEDVQRLYANLEQLSAAPAGTNFIAIFQMPENGPRRIFFNERQVGEAQRVDSIAWSPDGKRYAVECKTDRQSEFMIIDGKRGAEYRNVSLLRDGVDWSPARAFTADSSKAIYSAATDKRFLVVNDEESEGYADIREITLSEQGGHFGFIATESGGKKLLVIDGRASEPLADVRDLSFTPDGSHYAAMSGKKDQQKLIVDGVEQPQVYGDDLAKSSFSSDAGRNRHVVFSPSENHFVYVSELAPTGQDSKPHRAVCLDGKAEVSCGGARINPFFTPDSRHLVWVAWDGYRVSSYSVHLDGKPVAQFESPDIPHNLGGVTAKVGDFFARAKNSAEMGADGVLGFLAPVGNVIKKMRVIPSAETSLATFAAAAEQNKNAAEKKEKEPASANW